MSPPDRLVGADRRAKNDAIGAADGAGQIVGDHVAKAQRLRPLQHPDRMIGENDAPRRMAPAAARAIDEPISPTPMIASSSNIGSASGPEPVNHPRLA